MVTSIVDREVAQPDMTNAAESERNMARTRRMTPIPEQVSVKPWEVQSCNHTSHGPARLKHRPYESVCLAAAS